MQDFLLFCAIFLLLGESVMVLVWRAFTDLILDVNQNLWNVLALALPGEMLATRSLPELDFDYDLHASNLMEPIHHD